MSDKIKNSLFFSIYLICTLHINAQNSTISGHIYDTDTNIVDNAEIVYVDSTGNFLEGIRSDLEGRFYLYSNKKAAKLIVYKLGFHQYEIDVNNFKDPNEYNVHLEYKNYPLPELDIYYYKDGYSYNINLNKFTDRQFGKILKEDSLSYWKKEFYLTNPDLGYESFYDSLIKKFDFNQNSTDSVICINLMLNKNGKMILQNALGIKSEKVNSLKSLIYSLDNWTPAKYRWEEINILYYQKNNLKNH